MKEGDEREHPLPPPSANSLSGGRSGKGWRICPEVKKCRFDFTGRLGGKKGGEGVLLNRHLIFENFYFSPFAFHSFCWLFCSHGGNKSIMNVYLTL